MRQRKLSKTLQSAALQSLQRSTIYQQKPLELCLSRRDPEPEYPFWRWGWSGESREAGFSSWLRRSEDRGSRASQSVKVFLWCLFSRSISAVSSSCGWGERRCWSLPARCTKWWELRRSLTSFLPTNCQDPGLVWGSSAKFGTGYRVSETSLGKNY